MIKNPNLVEVSIWFPYVNPLLCKLRISDAANPALDVEEFAHIPGSKRRCQTKVWISLSWQKETQIQFNFCGEFKHTHQSEWRICTWSQAPSPEAKLRLAGGLLETSLLHRPFSAPQNILFTYTRTPAHINMTLISRRNSDNTLILTNLCYAR